MVLSTVAQKEAELLDHHHHQGQPGCVQENGVVTTAGGVDACCSGE